MKRLDKICEGTYVVDLDCEGGHIGRIGGDGAETRPEAIGLAFAGVREGRLGHGVVLGTELEGDSVVNRGGNVGGVV